MKIMVIEIKHYQLKNILTKLGSLKYNHLKDSINNLKKSDNWKTQLTIAITFMCSKDNDEERLTHSKKMKL